jgi:hypothetical protein
LVHALLQQHNSCALEHQTDKENQQQFYHVTNPGSE